MCERSELPSFELFSPQRSRGGLVLDCEVAVYHELDDFRTLRSSSHYNEMRLGVKGALRNVAELSTWVAVSIRYDFAEFKSVRNSAAAPNR